MVGGSRGGGLRRKSKLNTLWSARWGEEGEGGDPGRGRQCIAMQGRDWEPGRHQRKMVDKGQMQMKFKELDWNGMLKKAW